MRINIFFSGFQEYIKKKKSQLKVKKNPYKNTRDQPK